MTVISTAPNGGGPAPAHPFGSHWKSYAPGTILPSHLTQANLDSATAAFYDSWKTQYVQNGCGTDRFYVNPNADTGASATGGGKDPNSISISEGHGYGMMIMVFMAGHDGSAKATFDGMYRFFRDHPDHANPDLMAWNQVKGCVDANTANNNGNDSATDGDLDIAYALLLADRQWGSAGAINYAGEAAKVIANVMRAEINQETFDPGLSDDLLASSDPQFHYGTRPSDFMPDHFKSFAQASGDGRWSSAVGSVYSLVSTMQGTYSHSTGLLPDFITGTNQTPKPVSPNYLEAADDGSYSYNACRVPWRIGMDAILNGDAKALEALATINGWVRQSTGDNPGNIVDGYTLDGAPLPGTSSSGNLAFIGPLMVSSMTEARNQVWLNKLWDAVSATPQAQGDYYSNTLKLLTMIAASGNWWAP